MKLEEAYKLAVEVLSESVKYKTVLGEQYEEIVNYYSEVLAKHGVHVTVHRVPDEYTRKHLAQQFNPDKPRYILLARVGYGERVLQFNGHYDVVPAGEGWSKPPFEPTITNGKLFGRGSSDMKGGIAAIIATLVYFAQTREPGIVLEAAFVPDEEIGGTTGTGYLVNELGSRPNWVVIAEPSGLNNIYVGHRGNVWCLVKVHGKQAHGSTPWLGDNAFEKMLVFARRFIEEYRAILANRISSYKYEHPEASKPSINPGGLLVSPGAVNVVPGFVGFSIDRRLVVEEKADNVVAEIMSIAERISHETGIKVSVDVLSKSDPAYTPEDSPIVKTLVKSITQVTGVSPRTTICVGGLDLKYYTARGIPAVAYGPGKVEVAHKVDEYIELEDLRRTVEIYINLVKNLEKESE
ncbi:MAG: M20 family metallopeptidase [Desulfurococcaceae archaeon]